MTTNYSTGHEAEKHAAKYLEDLEYNIVALNWTNRLAEIDIVAESDEVIYFVEVKYRSSGDQGRGLDYITPAKLRQMEFAATAWCLDNEHEGDYELSAIEMSADFVVTEFIEQLTQMFS